MLLLIAVLALVISCLMMVLEMCAVRLPIQAAGELAISYEHRPFDVKV